MQPQYDFVYLASQSPRRQELLKQIDVQYRLLLPDANEDAEALEEIITGEKPFDYVQRVTLAKLQAALVRYKRKNLPHAPILCADTVVCKQDTIYGKPRDEDDARQILHDLQGSSHTVMTAVALGCPGGSSACGQADDVWDLRVNISKVTLAAMGTDEIEAYIQSKEPFGKAGAYGIQGKMGAYIRHIDGSYSGIMGLPLYETTQLLNAKLVAVFK